MTDKVKAFTVILEKDVRVDDFESIKNAALMIKGVNSIIPSIISSEDEINRSRIRQEMIEKFWRVINE